MIPKLNYHEHLEIYNKKHKLQDYYTTSEVIKITGISERTLRSRLSDLKIKYQNQTKFLYKENNKWYISKLIVDEFYSRYKPKKATRYNQRWESFITWVMKDNYDDDAHNYLINQVKKAFPNQEENEWCFVIEKTKRGVNHVHGLSKLDHETLFPIIHQIIKDSGIIESEYDVLVGEIENRHCAEKYLRK